MNDPSRWLEDTETPAELRQLLSDAERPHELDATTRSRVGARVTRLAVPLSLATWLSIKSAAAIGVVAGLVTAGAGLGISTYAEQQASSGASATVTSPGPAHRDSRVAASPLEPPTLNPVPSLPQPQTERAPPASAAFPPARSGSLAEESLLLERARRSLSGAPADALLLAREHTARFQHGQLASERDLVELEALHRLGRHAEARTLAERLLAGSGDDLYRARIERLLQKIDGGR